MKVKNDQEDFSEIALLQSSSTSCIVIGHFHYAQKRACTFIYMYITRGHTFSREAWVCEATVSAEDMHFSAFHYYIS